MGKLGGHELNFGSDLDVLLVYDEGDTESPPEGFASLLLGFITADLQADF